MKNAKMLAIVVLALGLMVWSAPMASGAQSLTVNGQDVTSITLELGQSRTIEVVSTDGTSYVDYVGFDNGVVRGTFSYLETKDEAGNLATVLDYNQPAFYGYYVSAAGPSPPPSKGVHFVFEYVAQEVGTTYVKLYNSTFTSLIDYIHITVIPLQPVAIGTAFTYQGRLIDANDVADGLYDFEFKLYDNADPVFAAQQGSTIDINDLDVIDGYFTVELDFGSDVFAGDARWLETTVSHADGSDPWTLSPRQELTPTPYAINADKLDGLHSGSFSSAAHLHDTRYYTETESDSRFVNVTGDSMTGALNMITTGTSINVDANPTGTTVYGVKVKADQSAAYNYQVYGLYSDTDSAASTAATYGTYSSAAGNRYSYGVYGYGLSNTRNAYGLYGQGYIPSSVTPNTYHSYGLYGTSTTYGTGNAYGANNSAYQEGTSGTAYGTYSYARGSDTSHAYGTYSTAYKYSADTGGYAYGGYFTGDNDDTGNSYGIYTRAIGTGGGTNYGIYAVASGGTTNYAGYFNGNTYISGNLDMTQASEGSVWGLSVLGSGTVTPGGFGIRDSGIYRFLIDSTGNVAVGTTTMTAGYRLKVAGNTITTGTARVSGTSELIGNVGIGTTSTTSYQLYVADSQAFGHVAKFENTYFGTNADGIVIEIGPSSNPTSLNYFVRFADGDGSMVGGVRGNGAGGVFYSTSSDARLKTKIDDFAGGLDMVSRMKVRKYEFIEAPGNERIGFLAQEMQTVLPQVVSGDPEGDVAEEPMGIDYGRMTPVLVSSIQELIAENETLKQRLERLERTIQQLTQGKEFEL